MKITKHEGHRSGGQDDQMDLNSYAWASPIWIF